MAEIDYNLIQELQTKFNSNLNITDNNSKDAIITIELKDNAFELIKYLKDSLAYNFLTDLCGMHFPEEKEYTFAVVYHLHNWTSNTRLRIKCYLKESPKTLSVSSLFASANWQERETFDFYGIEFLNHPDLRRILNMDEMVSFPLRKEFPMEDSGRTDKDDRYFGRISNQIN